MKGKKPWVERLQNLAVLLAVGYICFILGAFITQFRVAPFYGMMVPSFRAMVALREAGHDHEPGVLSSPWQLARRQGKGLMHMEAEACSPGFTFLTTGGGPAATLIDERGQSVHEWRAPFGQVWPDASHLARPPDEDKVAWPRALLYPNGDILAVYSGGGITPWGCGLAKLDKDSRVLWHYDQSVHHDVSVGEDGEIYTLIHTISQDKVDWLEGVYPPYLDDAIVTLSRDGVEKQRINILSAFRDTAYQTVLQENLVADAKGDLLHANCVKPIPAAFAEKVPFASEGQLMVSLRTPNLLAVVDPSTEKVVWASTGPWAWQHDPDPLPNGNILLFDNLSLMPEERSRVLEYDPRKKRIVWEFGGRKRDRFFSHFWGTQQKLPNGNILTSESAAGRIVEITPDKRIVWAWLNPQQRGDLEEYRAVVYSAVRIAPGTLTFLASAGEVKP